jgi:hypothetical protein
MLWAATVTEELRNDVRFALRFKVGRKQQPLTDTERDIVAAPKRAALPSVGVVARYGGVRAAGA